MARNSTPPHLTTAFTEKVSAVLAPSAVWWPVPSTTASATTRSSPSTRNSTESLPLSTESPPHSESPPLSTESAVPSTDSSEIRNSEPPTARNSEPRRNFQVLTTTNSELPTARNTEDSEPPSVSLLPSTESLDLSTESERSSELPESPLCTESRNHLTTEVFRKVLLTDSDLVVCPWRGCKHRVNPSIFTSGR